MTNPAWDSERMAVLTRYSRDPHRRRSIGQRGMPVPHRLVYQIGFRSIKGLLSIGTVHRLARTLIAVPRAGSVEIATASLAFICNRHVEGVAQVVAKKAEQRCTILDWFSHALSFMSSIPLDQGLPRLLPLAPAARTTVDPARRRCWGHSSKTQGESDTCAARRQAPAPPTQPTCGFSPCCCGEWFDPQQALARRVDLVDGAVLDDWCVQVMRSRNGSRSMPIARIPRRDPPLIAAQVSRARPRFPTATV